METKRLFIGGLYSDIKEVDLRNRFKTFGTVSSVEIIRRTDETGCPIKTFAYVDILQTESDFRKCVSLLSNSKWKGCCLKVQAAKESFLARLERERQQKDQASILSLLESGTKNEAHREQETQKQNAIPETLPKAVPGTPLPGKKNWVVGKFGRVLPVVYLRRRDRKKIAKFGPSKTTHCLKKIKPEESTIAVSELTWNLESEKEIHLVNGSSGNLLKMKGKKQNNLKRKGGEETGTNYDVDNGLEKHKKKASEDTSKINNVPFPSATQSSKMLPVVVGDLESDSSTSHSDADQHSITKRMRSASSNTEENSSDTFDSSTASTSPFSDVDPIVSSLSKNIASVELDATPKKKTKLSLRASEVESSSCTIIQNKNNPVNSKLSKQGNVTVQVTNDEYLSDENSSTNKNSSDSSDEASDIESSGCEGVIKTSRDQISSEIDTKLSNSDDLPVSSPRAKDESKVADNSHKQKHSNEKRLDALQEKRKNVLAQRNVIKDALKDLDSSTQSLDGKKHIVFSDDEEDESDDKATLEKAPYSVGDKISGSKASSWLGLDSESDEDHDQAGDRSDGEKEQLVTVKPHFKGKAGEELFKLQRTFGGDKRFELDSRFLDSEEEGDGHDHMDTNQETVKSDGQRLLLKDYTETDLTQRDDEISRSLTEEKKMAMKVVSNILGGDFSAEYGSRESQDRAPEFRNSSVVHYDPDREDHRQFEQTVSEEIEKQGLEPAFDREKRSEDPVLPEVSKDKYHDVNTSSLAELFGNKKQGASFTFLSQDPEDDADSTAEEHSHVGAVEEIKTNPWQTTTKLPYDSSDENEDGGDVDFEDAAVHNDIQSSKSTSHLDELFFFHPDDPKLANRINDQQTPFMRAGSQEEVSEYWVSVRSDLTQDYKRKRKDAVRRQNKLAAKRTRQR